LYTKKKVSIAADYVFQYYDLAADVLAENAHLTYKYLSTVSIWAMENSFDLAIYTEQLTHCSSVNMQFIQTNNRQIALA